MALGDDTVSEGCNSCGPGVASFSWRGHDTRQWQQGKEMRMRITQPRDEYTLVAGKVPVPMLLAAMIASRHGGVR